MFTASFDHIHIKTDDTVGCARFFIDVLKAKLVGDGAIVSGQRLTVTFGTVAIFIDTASPGIPGPQIIEHIAIAVDDIDAFARHLDACGHHFHKAPITLRPDLTIAFVMAPGNVMVEVLQRGSTPSAG